MLVVVVRSAPDVCGVGVMICGLTEPVCVPPIREIGSPCMFFTSK